MTSCQLSCSKTAYAEDYKTGVSRQKRPQIEMFHIWWWLLFLGWLKWPDVKNGVKAHSGNMCYGNSDLRSDWQPLQRVEFHFQLCACKAIPPLFCVFPTFYKKHGQRKQKREAPFLPARVLFPGLTFAVVSHPPVAVFAFALVWARRVVAGGEAAAVALT